jgi:hypothetical protein
MVTGPRSMTHVTLSRKADMTPASIESRKKIAVALPRAAAATRTADHSNTPVSDRRWTSIIIEKSSSNVPQSTWPMIVCSSWWRNGSGESEGNQKGIRR